MGRRKYGNHELNNVESIDSPCIGQCTLNDDNVCLGCFRSLDEIVQWGTATNQKRTIFLQNTRQRREVYEKKFPWRRSWNRMKS